LSFAAASCLKTGRKLSPSGRNALAASPNRPVRAGKPIDLGLLYLVLSLAANTKYSINSFFFFQPNRSRWRFRKKSAKKPVRRADHPPGHMRMIRDFMMRTDLVTLRSSRRRNLDFINLICPIPVKGWFVKEV
jgi:hypothetical protein